MSVGYRAGKRYRKTFYGKTRDEVRRKLSRALADAERGLDVNQNERLTVERYLKQWLAHVRPRLAPKTYRSYADTCRLHINPTLGRIPLVKLTPRQVQRLLDEKAVTGLSARTVAYIRTVLRVALNRAVKWELVHRNVATLVDVPSQVKYKSNPFTPDEARRFLEAIRGDRLEALFTVALALGLRQGEALGLCWDDVDLDARRIHVRNALQRIGGQLQLKELKTAGSERTISLPRICVESLERHREMQQQEHLANAAEWNNELNLVFTSTVGTPLDPGNVYKRFKRILREAGLPDQRFHDLRHCCASLLIAQKVPERMVMEVLGHTQLATTMDIYGHMFEESKQEAADQMDAVLRGKSGSDE